VAALSRPRPRDRIVGVRAGLAALIATGVLVPLAAGGAATLNATAVVAGSGTEYTITVTNTGDESIICMTFFPKGVNVVKVFGPGPPRPFEGGFGAGDFVLLRGHSATWRFTTDKAMEVNAGGELRVSADCSGNDVVVDATGPAPGEAPPPPPCKCLTLTARIVPSSIAITNPGSLGGVHLTFAMHWTMNCTSGVAGCNGTLDLVPPKGRTYRSYFNNASTHIACNGDCAKLTEGTQKFTLIGNRGLGADRRGKMVTSIPITIDRSCQSKTLRQISLRLVFNKSTALVDKKKSKLR